MYLCMYIYIHIVLVLRPIFFEQSSRISKTRRESTKCLYMYMYICTNVNNQSRFPNLEQIIKMWNTRSERPYICMHAHINVRTWKHRSCLSKHIHAYRIIFKYTLAHCQRSCLTMWSPQNVEWTNARTSSQKHVHTWSQEVLTNSQPHIHMVTGIASSQPHTDVITATARKLANTYT